MEIKNTTIKQGIAKSNMNMTSPPETLRFSCSLQKDTCDILSEILVSQMLQEFSSINEGDVLRYINKAKPGHEIVPPRTCGYKHCGKKQV